MYRVVDREISEISKFVRSTYTRLKLKLFYK